MIKSTASNWSRFWTVTFHTITCLIDCSNHCSHIYLLLSTTERSGDSNLSSLSHCSQQSRRRMCVRLSPSCWRLTSIHHRQATRCLMTFQNIIDHSKKKNTLVFIKVYSSFASLVCEGMPLLWLLLRENLGMTFVLQHLPRVVPSGSAKRFLWKS